MLIKIQETRNKKQVQKSLLGRGQSLIELLIAIAAVSVLLISVASAATKATAGQFAARAQAQSTKLAQEQLERLRALRDRNGLNAVSCGGTCSINSSLAISGSSFSVGDVDVWFTVTIPGSCPGGNRQIIAIGRWTDKAGNHDTRLTTCLSGWK